MENYEYFMAFYVSQIYYFPGATGSPDIRKKSVDGQYYIARIGTCVNIDYRITIIHLY